MIITKNNSKKLLVITIIIVTILSLFPVPDVGQSQDNHFDKIVHIIMYLCISLLAVYNYSNKKLWIIVITIILYGILIEIVQEISGVRSGDFYDAVANSIGAVLGAYFGKKLYLYSTKTRTI